MSRRRLVDIVLLSQQLKKQRNFLRWMSRRYSELNPDQGAAFATGAKILEELRQDLAAGVYDLESKELFTETRISPATQQVVPASVSKSQLRRLETQRGSR